MTLEENINLDGKILEIIPVSAYQGKTYTQDIIVEFSNGKICALEDNRMLCSENMINKIISFKITIIFLSTIKTNLERIKDINPVDTNRENYQGPYADLFGCLKKIILPKSLESQKIYRNAILDIGTGTVWMEIGNFKGQDFTSFKEGDFIRINHACLTIDDFNLNTI